MPSPTAGPSGTWEIPGPDRPNHLNAIRLVLSLAVLVCHAFPLSLGHGPRLGGFWPGFLESLGGHAVNLFFFISGFLITASWLRSPSMSEFFAKRILRIYPGYVVAMLFSGAVIWVACPEFRAGAGRGISWGYAITNDLFHLSNISISGGDGWGWKGVFSRNPYPGTANGSLWTISIEFRCYMYAAALGVFGFLARKRMVWKLALASLLFYAANFWRGADTDTGTSRFLWQFFCGAGFWVVREKLPLSHAAGAVSLGAWLTLCAVESARGPCFWSFLTCPVLGGYGVLWLASLPSSRLLEWTRKTDLSYGVYLYAFPIQQLVAMQPGLRDPLLNIVIAAPVTLMLAWLSWTFVERPFLRWKQAVGQSSGIHGAHSFRSKPLMGRTGQGGLKAG